MQWISRLRCFAAHERRLWTYHNAHVPIYWRAIWENIPLADGVADIVLANASFNLTVSKKKALEEAHRILKPGGRLVARELIREGEVPDEIAQDPQAWNASLGGVCEQGEWESLLMDAGFHGVEISDTLLFVPWFLFGSMPEKQSKEKKIE